MVEKHGAFLLCLLLMSIVIMYALSTVRMDWLQFQLYMQNSVLRTDTKEVNEKSSHLVPVPNLNSLYRAGSDHKPTPPTNHQYLEGVCKPKTNILFIKTVKVGGTTLLNILERFAFKHNIRLLKLDDFRNTSLQIQRTGIFGDHIFYYRKVLNDIMPSDVIYVTQLRHPLTQLVSLINWRGYSNVSDPVKFYRNWHSEFKYSIWNTWRQLCIPRNISHKELYFFLDKLTEQFVLVTIAEEFDLSLLLLRRKLCWDITDMLYIRRKKADYKFFNNSNLLNMIHSEIINKKYEKLNPHAYSLYRHFNQTLSNLIAEAGPDLQEELVWFQDQNQKVSNYCSKYIELIVQNISKFLDVVNTSDVLNIPSSKWGRAKIFDPVECAMLKLKSETFQRISDVKQTHLNQSVHLLENSEYFTNYQLYGTALPELTNAQAYDLEEDAVQHGITYQSILDAKSRIFQVEVQLLDRCAAENDGS